MSTRTIIAGIAALLLTTGAAHAQAQSRVHVSCFATLCIAEEVPVHITILKVKPVSPDLKPVFGPLVCPPTPPDRLGPAVWSARPWEAERMPYTKVPAINDPLIAPPEVYDHEYNGRITVKRTDERGIQMRCWSVSKTACAYLPDTYLPDCTKTANDNTCTLWIVYDDILNYQRLSYEMVYRHERAHCEMRPRHRHQRSQRAGRRGAQGSA